ncbi:hypothetical protein FOMPIDRAFT_1017827 [Fomitopsis schrenkii]|uniref:DUF6699 domain-containing protein n=1 Tax=Fomitopsis schrenkii TaxID=2126942 RepID=S8F9L0_FOMSC|nr:hypothetical protein FOMPIDRAFT_1017827 [Fomitopsis schrenkii]
MQYPSTPSSSSTRVPTTPVPNAPYMSPKDLPPSPVTPTHALPGYGAPIGALQMYPMGYGAAPAPQASYGLMTPPTTPERARGQRGFAGYAIRPVLSPQALRFNIAQPLTAIRYAAPYSERDTYETFTTPPTSVVYISVIGVFRFEVHARQRSGVTVRDVLEGVLSAMAHTATEHEARCFTQEVQQSVVMSRTPRRYKYLGPRVVFSGIEVTHASAGAVYCDLHLATQ